MHGRFSGGQPGVAQSLSRSARALGSILAKPSGRARYDHVSGVASGTAPVHAVAPDKSPRQSTLEHCGKRPLAARRTRSTCCELQLAGFATAAKNSDEAATLSTKGGATLPIWPLERARLAGLGWTTRSSLSATAQRLPPAAHWRPEFIPGAARAECRVLAIVRRLARNAARRPTLVRALCRCRLGVARDQIVVGGRPDNRRSDRQKRRRTRS